MVRQSETLRDEKTSCLAHPIFVVFWAHFHRQRKAKHVFEIVVCLFFVHCANRKRAGFLDSLLGAILGMAVYGAEREGEKK